MSLSPVARVVGGLVLALVTAACGRATASPITAASDGPAASVAAPVTSAARGSFSLALPLGWRQVKLGSPSAGLVAQVTKENARVGQSLAAQLAKTTARTVYYSFDDSPATVGSGALVSLTVVRVDLPQDVTLADFSKVIRGQIEQVTEGNVSPTRVMTSSGPADRYVYEAGFAQPSGPDRVAPVTQYLIVVPGAGYELTFATTPDRTQADAPVFESIAQSFSAAP